MILIHLRGCRNGSQLCKIGGGWNIIIIYVEVDASLYRSPNALPARFLKQESDGTERDRAGQVGVRLEARCGVAVSGGHGGHGRRVAAGGTGAGGVRAAASRHGGAGGHGSTGGHGDTGHDSHGGRGGGGGRGRHDGRRLEDGRVGGAGCVRCKRAVGL